MMEAWEWVMEQRYSKNFVERMYMSWEAIQAKTAFQMLFMREQVIMNCILSCDGIFEDQIPEKMSSIISGGSAKLSMGIELSFPIFKLIDVQSMQ